ncbi:alpha-pore-forming cytotoxin subunit MakB [Massilia niastensis]|uniref:alpha-pore-forming cytotoxin subunit MakB n=1 Tax=Massilia niastensis TaxID=544911 RepID=UPI00036B9655|nr:hypothetical protein [Massilia niastensis]
MLSPAINTAKDLLTQALNEVIRLDKYATSADNIVIGKLPADPDWLASVRSRTSQLGDAGVAWMMEKPDLWATVLVQFTDYVTAFQGVAEMAQGGKITTSAQWVDLLSHVLLPQLGQAVALTNAVDVRVQKAMQRFSVIQPLLEASIDEGWTELAHEEQQMIKLASELTHLQDKVASLESSITSGVISSGQGAITTSVKTIYSIVTAAGAGFSFLSLGVSVLTVGKSYYDLVTATNEIADTLTGIAALQLQASEEAQAAAGTKLILQLVYNLQKSFLAIQHVLPQISAMWNAELEKLQSVIEALQSGADPQTYFEIFSIPTAAANWQAINDFAMAIPNLKREVGKPVLLNPLDPI